MRAATARTIQAHRLSPAETFLLLCKAHGLPAPEVEYRFDALRRWRMDYAWVGARVALECDGGIWNRGKHGRGLGILRGNEKANASQLAGWMLGRFTPAQMNSGEAVAWVQLALEIRAASPVETRIEQGA